MTEDVRYEVEQKHMEATLYGLVGAIDPGFDDFISRGLEKAMQMLSRENLVTE